MKAKHRHELKTNELAEWIANLPQWAKENLRIIIYVSVAAVLVVSAYFYIRYQKKTIVVQEKFKLTELISRLSQSKKDILRARSGGADVSYVLIQLADDLRTFARNAKNDQRAALALIKRAEALRAELHYRSGTVDRQDLAAQIEQARECYNEALEKSSSNPSLMAMAKFGLGLCEEELGNFDQARQIYSDLAANPQFQSTPVTVQAKQRLETMADYQQKVVFNVSQDRPRPAPASLLQPQIQLAPVDINLADTKLDDVNLSEP